MEGLHRDVELTGITKRYGDFLAVNHVDLAIERGEMVSFLGPSGCGKTTTLRMIAGLEFPDEGEIFIRGKRVNAVPTYKRNIGMVFQNYALFPHMTIRQNIAFGLSMRKEPRASAARKVDEAMALTHLEGMADRLPSQLSGGQRQRVALARAIVTRPNVLLLDEPLGALDKKLREQMQIEIRMLQREVGITTIFVTHDQEEALTLSDRIVVMNAGQIVQVGTPEEIYKRPASSFVSDFIGLTNTITAGVIGVNETAVRAQIADSTLELLLPTGGSFAVGQQINLSVRPENIALGDVPTDGYNRFGGTISHVVYTGALTYFHVDIGVPGNRPFVVMVPNTDLKLKGSAGLEVGDKITIGWRYDNTQILEKD
ncbi:MAG TPA: ABC transporter ATP-binding protein [Burkholderiaceae bacterium]|nr:ABC transporter ATP-binding protein [Burkholderiaceae bacterium]